jgi:prolyl oligopeptidase
MPATQTFPDRLKIDDEFAWLEEIASDRALDWVTQQNHRTEAMLHTKRFTRMNQRILDVLDSTARIPEVAKRGAFLYNFWKDAEHPRGLWRRTTFEEYRTEQPPWDVLLDIDELCRAEGVQWVFAGARLLFPDYKRALIQLSPDGGDAVAIREFDLESRVFIPDGFTLPIAKTSVSWIDDQTIFVATDFGPGSLTTSSYPRFVKRWLRGYPLESAEMVLEIPEEHMIATGEHDHTIGFERDVVDDVIDFYTSKHYLVRDGELRLIDVPDDAEIGFHREWLIVRLRSDWSVNGQPFVTGSLIATKFEPFLAGERTFELLFQPDEHASLVSWSRTRNHLLLTTLHDVASRLLVISQGPDGWQSAPLSDGGELLSQSVTGVDPDTSDEFWLQSNGFVQPASLWVGTVGNGEIETLKHAPSFFDASRFRAEQHFVTSDDGTRVPYFLIAKRDLALDGSNPTVLNGYGGFEIPLTPSYDGAAGPAWLELGGVLVIANIRGGGEYGPAWHKSALRNNRVRAYQDFAAVAQDLIRRGVTSPAHLGCTGGSNGGLLVGNMLTHYPQLFGAIVCKVPLLDMKRYTKLSAGYSWIAEYGDPEIPEDWDFIQAFSPYHNLRDGVTYPPVLFYTATSDDRVGPVQARKMAARMQARGIPDVWFYENREGGHGAASDNKQAAHLRAAGYEFLWQHLA